MAKYFRIFSLLLVGIVGEAAPVNTQVSGDTDTAAGQALFAARCAACHSSVIPGSPTELVLAEMPQDLIIAAMREGAMRQQATGLGEIERQQIATFIRRNQPATKPASVRHCENNQSTASPSILRSAYAGWGGGINNSRNQAFDASFIGSENVDRLKLRWAFAYPDANRARSHPLIFGSLVIVGAQNGTVYALDRATGCVRWTFRASAEIRNGITPLAIKAKDGSIEAWYGFFSDFGANAFAIDLLDGSLVWKAALDEHPGATGTGQSAAYGDTVYFPVSSVEVGAAAAADYPCCTFRGSVVALDARTGKQRWKQHTVTGPAVSQGVNPAGTPSFGPSGAPVWSTPTIDVKRGQLYVGTGENYSEPADSWSDSIIAMRLDTGAVRWTYQATEGDAWNAACITGFGAPDNCPASDGPDFDFGAPPILHHGKGRDVVLAGQKSGAVFALDPDNGALVWTERVGRGGVMGGIHFGMAANSGQLFVPVNDSDIAWERGGEARPALLAMDPESGRIGWRFATTNEVCGGAETCEMGISAPVSAIGDLVFAPHSNGLLRVHDAATGELRWQYDTATSFATVSGDSASGGGLSGGSGVVAADGWLFMNSGYYMALSPNGGNVLLAFSLERP